MVNDGVNQIFTYTEAATPTVGSVRVSGEDVIISGVNFQSSSPNGVSVKLIRHSARIRRNAEGDANESEEERTYSQTVHADESPEDKQVLMPLLDENGTIVLDENGMPLMVHDESTSGEPSPQSDLFDELDATTDFWGVFTNSSVKSYNQSKVMGAWRVGGSQPIVASQPDQPDLQVTRIKRQINETSYPCIISSVNDTSILCTASGILAGRYELEVSVEGLGDAIVNVTNVTVATMLVGVMPSSGSVHGDSMLTITGYAFIPGVTQVRIDEQYECEIVSINSTSVICRSPPHAAGEVNLVVTVGDGGPNLILNYSYTQDKTPALVTVR